MIYEQVTWRPEPNTLRRTPSVMSFNSFQFSNNTAILSVTCCLKWHRLSLLHRTLLCMNLLNHQLFWFLGLAGFLSFPWKPLCSPYTTYWQCHLTRVFQHRSAPWHQTLAWCTKFTKTFGTSAWLTLWKTPFHPQFENSFLVTSKRPLGFCIRKNIFVQLPQEFIQLWYTEWRHFEDNICMSPYRTVATSLRQASKTTSLQGWIHLAIAFFSRQCQWQGNYTI